MAGTQKMPKHAVKIDDDVPLQLLPRPHRVKIHHNAVVQNLPEPVKLVRVRQPLPRRRRGLPNPLPKHPLEFKQLLRRVRNSKKIPQIQKRDLQKLIRVAVAPKQQLHKLLLPVKPIRTLDPPRIRRKRTLLKHQQVGHKRVPLPDLLRNPKLRQPLKNVRQQQFDPRPNHCRPRLNPLPLHPLGQQNEPPALQRPIPLLPQIRRRLWRKPKPVLY